MYISLGIGFFLQLSEPTWIMKEMVRRADHFGDERNVMRALNEIFLNGFLAMLLFNVGDTLTHPGGAGGSPQTSPF